MPARLRATTRKAAASRRIRSTGARRRSARGGEARVGIAIRSSSHESQGPQRNDVPAPDYIRRNQSQPSGPVPWIKYHPQWLCERLSDGRRARPPGRRIPERRQRTARRSSYQGSGSSARAPRPPARGGYSFLAAKVIPPARGAAEPQFDARQWPTFAAWKRLAHSRMLPGIARVCCYNRARDWSEVNYGTKADKRSGERTRDDLAGPRRSRGGSLC